MNLRDFYYKVKPLIPRFLQIALRRQIAIRKLKSVRKVWPIDPEAGKVPQEWKGWPDQKRFALVLSHDVDTARGRDRCLQLMELEKELGFRSSFNFVPEGYAIANGVFETLRKSDFGIGVHGLVHDEKLFNCRKMFERRAPRINNYLKEWGAVGFHSPAMIRNLDWIGELDIEYDGSTFDTDPFEPQPDGVRTIFPFVVYKRSCQQSAISSQLLTTADCRPPTADSTNPSNSTDSSNSTNSQPFYVELPYTLPQDHCLFVILKQKDIRIWRQKLDWIVEKGGMALLNSHPDYMNFRGGKCGLEEYDASMYMEFLQYVKSKYTGQYWQALPREMARFWKRAMIK